MNEYDIFTELVPQEIKEKIPENRMHHALWNMSNLIKEENPEDYTAAVKKDASDEAKQKMTSLIENKWKEVMEWHFKNGFVTNDDHPQEIKREPVSTDPETNKKILALVKPEYLKRIPFFVKGHATGKTCELIAREFPDLYDDFKNEPDDSQKQQMSKLINSIFEERMAKHNM